MYRKRFIEELIEKKLRSTYCVNVVGPKFCGKTTTCGQFAKSKIKLISQDIIDVVKASPRVALEGERLRLIDEWQTAPILWDKIRNQADTDEAKFGQYLLTGSATPADQDELNHTGSGRIVSVRMRPMSLYESGESKGKVSIKELFDNPSFDYVDLNQDYDLEDTVFLMARGGWPLSTLIADRSDALEATKSYFSSLFEFKTSDNKKFRNKKPAVARMLLRSYARNISTEALDNTLIADVIGNEKRTSFAFQTFTEYDNVLKDLFLVENLEAWNPQLRSKAIVRSAEVRHFVDASIAMAALEITPDMLLRSGKTLGLFFEDFAVRDLSIYAMANDAVLKHYRDSNGLECDAVMIRSDGKWGLIEAKLGSDDGIAEGAAHLNLLAEKIDTSLLGEPSFKMIVTSNGACQRRKDGIYVVPINMLKD
jgi:predicted AAA+ superfamily ATPase